MSTKRMTSSTIGALLLLYLPLCAQQAPGAGPNPPDKPVFAHYMVCYGSTVEFYKQEIELAQRHGIDGFALNCGQWLDAGGKPSAYVASAEKIYQAAMELNSGFRLFFSADVNGLGNLPENMGDMVSRFYKHPNQFRWGGKAVISAWAGGPKTYAAAIESIRKAGYEVCFVPFLYNPRYAMAWSYETVLEFFRDAPHMDGLFCFTADGLVNDILRKNAIARRVTQHLGKIYMAGACPAFNSPNLREFRGTQGYCAIWRGLIRDGADWVEIVTWNDYNEDSGLMPFRWPAGQEKDYFDRDETFLDLTAYYSAWFKTGQPPKIPQDKLYFTYRTRSKWQRKAWDAKDGNWVDLTAVAHPYDQIHDDVEDYIYCTTMLTAPAELTVTIGGEDKKFSQPAGVRHVEIPLAPGVPRFVLKRDGKELLAVDGRREIIAGETKENSPKGYHLLNRTWASGAAAGPVVATLHAESGFLQEGAKKVAVGAATCVRNAETDGSGFDVYVKNLPTGTYNVRITYSNPSETGARLTMSADGAPRAEKELAHYIPVFLPPTKQKELKTTSFFWSLYKGTTYLKLTWRKGMRFGSVAPQFDDRGSAAIDKIELIRVEPVQPALPPRGPWPEMVAIPGGSFTMGSEKGEPDERPAHKVTLSPFAIGRCEVTNAEYERFDPNHRRFRDGYSWRDGEPVIYVSWEDGAKYCNWLSAQAGLAPAYGQAEVTVGAGNRARKVKQTVLDAKADGFRMPTEAQWEYVATGRGEGRIYPWGDAQPVPGRHGNFALRDVLRIDANLPASTLEGVMVAGTYPAGASRDGVMDLAGNVCEWCSDWFEPYTDAARTDPAGEVPGNYRSIRGSSWGYYGLPVRNSDREFNNPKYPGYIYIGLRVALPEAGWKKLEKGMR